jgi:hypothetical protein
VERWEGRELANNWFTSMFSSEATEGDAITGRTLNITKITALLVPIGTGIVALLNEIAGDDGPFAGIDLWQKVAIALAVIVFIGIVVAVDMLSRAYATGKEAENASLAPLSFFAEPLTVRDISKQDNETVKAIASRTSNDGTTDFLVFGDDETPRWLNSSHVRDST